MLYQDFPGGSDGKASAYNAGDPGPIPGLGRSPGEGNETPLQYSFLETPMDGRSWQAIVQGVAKSRTRLSDFKKKNVYTRKVTNCRERLLKWWHLEGQVEGKTDIFTTEDKTVNPKET